MSIGNTLFPPANREAALVAFLRTFWQSLRSSAWIGGGGYVTVTALQLAKINLTDLGLAAAVILLHGLIAGLIAGGDILNNGLPPAYQNTAAASIPAAVLSTVPLVTPADPAQPSAGVPPAAVASADASAIPVQVPVAQAAAPAPAVAQPAATGDVTALPPVTA